MIMLRVCEFGFWNQFDTSMAMMFNYMKKNCLIIITVCVYYCTSTSCNNDKMLNGFMGLSFDLSQIQLICQEMNG